MKILIANDKGGVGKSTIAQYVVLRLLGAGGQPNVLDFDRQPKLGRLFGEKLVTSYPVGPSLTLALERPDRAEAFWDPLLRMLRVERPLVVDFGAQAFGSFAEWAMLTGLKSLHKGPGITVIVPLTADYEALNGARRVMAGLPELFPTYRVVLALSDKDGSLEGLRGLPEFDELVGRVNGGTIAKVEVPGLIAAGYPALAARGLDIGRVARSSIAELSAVAAMKPPLAARTIRGCGAWLQAMSEAFDTVLGLPGVARSPSPEDRADMPLPLVAPVPRPEPLRTPQVVVPSAPPPAPSPVPAMARPSVVMTPAAIQRPVDRSRVQGAAGMAPEEFNEVFYLSRYPDVARAVRAGEFKSGYDHFVAHGRLEGREAQRTTRR